MPSGAVQEWLDKAAEDEQVVALVQANGGPWSMAAYHIQQAAEKFIKAALVDAGVPPRKTHDLPQLIGMLPSQPSSAILSAAAAVSAFAWITRYPGGATFSGQDIALADQDLRAIKGWVLSIV